MIEKEFVPYDRALILKELRFDEPCFGCYVFGDELSIKYCEDQFVSDSCCLAPTFSQAFRWFREKCNLWQSIQKYPTSENPNRCYYELKGDNINTDKDEPANYYMSGWFDSYEEAELACLDKLIEIIENKEQ